MSLFADETILHIKISKVSTKKLLETVTKYSKIERFKIYIQKKLLLYILTTNYRKINRETKLFIIKKMIKIPRNKLNKLVKDLHTDNNKTLLKVIEDTNKLRSILCSLNERINILKIPTLLKAIYRFDIVTIKISMAFFTEKNKKF